MNNRPSDQREDLLHLKLRNRHVGIMRVIELSAPIPDMC